MDTLKTFLIALFLSLSGFLIVATGSSTFAADEKEYAARRLQLIQEITSDVRDTRHWIGKAELDPRVMAAMAKVERHKFVPMLQRHNAYKNRPLPIGYGQTISQPYIVALMTDLLELKKGAKVLEVGTGSAYQAAVLSEIVKQVYTIEIIPALGKQAAERLKQLKYTNVQTRIGDGYYGWKEAAPFDAIIVTAAANHIPPPLIRQLKPGGRMIIPVGGPFATQYLMLVKKDAAGKIKTRQMLPVRFVPLTGKH